MSEFKVNVSNLKQVPQDINLYKIKLGEIYTGIEYITNHLAMSDAGLEAIKKQLRNLLKEINTEKIEINSLGKALNEIIGLYEKTERKLIYSTTVEQKIKAAMEKIRQILKNLGKNFGGSKDKTCKYGGDPVNMSTGNYVDDVEEISIKAVIPLEFKRHYNTMLYKKNSMGLGWSHNYESCIKADNNELIIQWGTGAQEKFTLVQDKLYRSIYGSYDFVVEAEDGYCYQTCTGEKTKFDKEGKITAITDLNENSIEMFYDEGKLLRVQDNKGNYLVYQYDQQGMLTEVADHTGRNVHMEYTDGFLTKVIAADKSDIQYMYDPKGRLEKVIDANNNIKLQNEFNDKDQVVKQIFADGSSMYYEYDEDSLIFTNRNGSKVTYKHDEKMRHIETLYHDGSEKYVYNEKNQRIAYTDKMGNTCKRSFDDKGNITSLIDPLGNKTIITYESHNKPISVKKPDGGTLRAHYDTRGNLIKAIDTLGNETKIEYNETGRINRVIQADDSQISFRYDEKQRISEITDAAGNTERYEYDTLNRVIRTVDGNGGVTIYEYDELNRMKKVINALGQERSYTYTRTGKVAKIKDFDGFTEQWTYNKMDKPVMYIDKEGRITKQEYDEMSNVAKTIFPNGAFIQRKYNSSNQLEQITDQEGTEIKYQYDANGNRLSEEREGQRHSFKYDALNRLIAKTDILGHTQEVRLNAEGKVTWFKKEDGTVYTYVYDTMGNCIERTDASGNKTYYTYTSLGKIKTINGISGLISYSYYPGGLLKQVEYPDHTWIKYTYDSNGNIASKKMQNGYQLDYKYDSLNHIIAITDSEGATKTYAYDENGNVTSMKDAEGNTTSYRYSPGNRLIYVKDEMGNEVRYAYDSMNQLTAILKGNIASEEIKMTFNDEVLRTTLQNRENKDIHLTTYERNLNGQIKKITDALGNVEEYEYNALGQMIQHTDAEGFVTDYTYNKNGELEGICYADGRSVMLSYDPLNRLKKVQDWMGETNIEYDNLGHPVSVTDAKGQTIRYEWKMDGQKAAIEYPDGSRLSYEYDEFNRLINIHGYDQDMTYGYDTDSRLSEIKKGPNIKTTYLYDPKGQLRELTHQDEQGILYQSVYQYDKNGNPVVKTDFRRGMPEESGKYTYYYDSLNRLTRVEKDMKKLRAYEYDEYSNRISLYEENKVTKYEYNVLNQLILSNEQGEKTDTLHKYEYDNRGNMILMSDMHDQYHYQYDAMNLLIQVSTMDGSVSKYHYDGLKRRIGEERRQSQFDEEILKINYVRDFTKQYNDLLVKEESGHTENYIWGEQILGSSSQGMINYYLCDEKGSVISYLDKAGKQLSRYVYDEFGRDQAHDQMEKQTFGYTGLCYDKMTGGYYAQAREYLPQIGRFGAKDKDQYIHFKLPETINLYQYCVNNPVLFIDPAGTDCYIFYLPEWKSEADQDRTSLAKKYGVDESKVHLVEVSSAQDLTDGWNAMGKENGKDVDIDAVVINTHANANVLGFGNDKDGKSRGNFRSSDIRNLENKDVKDGVVLYGCNSGHEDYVGTNPASEFVKKTKGAPVVASDGTVYSRQQNTFKLFWLFPIGRDYMEYEPVGDEAFEDQLLDGERDNNGWLIYRDNNGTVEVEHTGKYQIGIDEMLDFCKDK